MRVPEKYYDEIFNYSGQWDVPSSCGLKIIRREKPIIIVTELYQDNSGTSVTAAGKNLAEQICRNKGLSLSGIMYIECNPDTDSKLSFYDEKFFEVDFLSGKEPIYRLMDAGEIKDLIDP
ncbi:MAG: hypothetical protein FWH35_03375 [Treponema sp.]|nr:hypothetical protein [Treponema sp.]